MTNNSTRARVRARARTVVFEVLSRSGIPALARRQWRGQLAILTYHGIETEPMSPPCSYVIDVETLRRELKYVGRCFNVLPIEEALERLRDGTLPDRAAVLTFDDGTRNLATNAAPVLRDLGLPAAIFVVTAPMGTGEALWPDRLWLAFANTKETEIDLSSIGLGTPSLQGVAERGAACEAAVARLKTFPDAERLEHVDSLVAALGAEIDAYGGPFQMLSWDEARELADGGLISIYPHSATHPILSLCPDDKVRAEITESCAALERQLGRRPTVFAYPNGDFDERAKEALRHNGVTWALATTKGFANADSDPLALPRIGIGDHFSNSAFRLHVSGALPLRQFRPWRRTSRGPAVTPDGRSKVPVSP